MKDDSSYRTAGIEDIVYTNMRQKEQPEAQSDTLFVWMETGNKDKGHDKLLTLDFSFL